MLLLSELTLELLRDDEDKLLRVLSDRLLVLWLLVDWLLVLWLDVLCELLESELTVELLTELTLLSLTELELSELLDRVLLFELELLLVLPELLLWLLLLVDPLLLLWLEWLLSVFETDSVLVELLDAELSELCELPVVELSLRELVEAELCVLVVLLELPLDECELELLEPLLSDRLDVDESVLDELLLLRSSNERMRRSGALTKLDSAVLNFRTFGMPCTPPRVSITSTSSSLFAGSSRSISSAFCSLSTLPAVTEIVCWVTRSFGCTPTSQTLTSRLLRLAAVPSPIVTFLGITRVHKKTSR